MIRALPKHIVRLLVILGTLLLLAYAARAYLTDPSYYRFGYYRADAVPELAAGSPRYLGSAYCKDECHQERSSDWQVSPHQRVQCEVCHGPDPGHPDDKKILAPAREDTVRLCTTCHLAMPARPSAQPQIVLGEHPVPDGEIMPCIDCHDPHSPGPVMREEVVAVAADKTAIQAPAIASKCAKCHGAQGEGVKNFPALAGMSSSEFRSHIDTYRSGGGNSKIMTRFAESLSEQEIAELAAFYEKLKKAEKD